MLQFVIVNGERKDYSLNALRVFLPFPIKECFQNGIPTSDIFFLYHIDSYLVNEFRRGFSTIITMNEVTIFGAQHCNARPGTCYQLRGIGQHFLGHNI
jgi:hypothetical protein